MHEPSEPPPRHKSTLIPVFMPRICEVPAIALLRRRMPASAAPVTRPDCRRRPFPAGVQAPPVHAPRKSPAIAYDVRYSSGSFSASTPSAASHSRRSTVLPPIRTAAAVRMSFFPTVMFIFKKITPRKNKIATSYFCRGYFMTEAYTSGSLGSDFLLRFAARFSSASF